MYDVFISYSANDEHLARFMHKHLTEEGVSVFLASVSLPPGQVWPQETLNALNSATWVLFLASRAACDSHFVQQEVGAALAARKQLIPVVWDMQPSDLPGWASQYQALNLAGKSIPEVQSQISAIATHIKEKKNLGRAIVGLLVAGLFMFGSK